MFTVVELLYSTRGRSVLEWEMGHVLLSVNYSCREGRWKNEKIGQIPDGVTKWDFWDSMYWNTDVSNYLLTLIIMLRTSTTVM